MSAFHRGISVLRFSAEPEPQVGNPFPVSPLKKGEEAEGIAMAKEDDCMREMFVLIKFSGRKLGMPLSQLEVLAAKGETHEAVDDWQYWAAMGYEF